MSGLAQQWLQASVGFVAKTIEIDDLVQLDSGVFISPVSDTIDVMGSRKIPSNIVLPDQTFTIYFFPIHVNKPVYRLPVRQDSKDRFFGISGILDAEEAVSAIRNSDPFGIINALETKKVGVSGLVSIPKSTESQVISLNLHTGTDLSKKVSVYPSSASRFGYIEPMGGSRKHLIASLWEIESGVFVPTDLKQVQENSFFLNSVGDQAKFLDILVRNQENRQYIFGQWLNTAGQTIRLLPSGASSDLNFRLDQMRWRVYNPQNRAQVVIGRLEHLKKTAIGSSRFEDRWIVVSSFSSEFELPENARRALAHQLISPNRVSVDLIDSPGFGYSNTTDNFNGDRIAQNLRSLEKVRLHLP